MATHTGDAGALLHLHFDPTGELLERTRECEARVFHHWYGNTRAELEQEYAPYAATSTFIALADTAGRVLGEVRVIRPGPAGLKTLHDITLPPWSVDADRAARAARMDLSSTWEIATMGVLPSLGARGVHHAMAIYHGLLLACRANAVSGGVAVMDQRVRSLLEAIGLVYPAIPGTDAAPYLGSPASVPVYVPIATMVDVQRRRAPEAHRLVAMGIGLDGVATPDPATFRLGYREDLAERTAAVRLTLPQQRRAG